MYLGIGQQKHVLYYFEGMLQQALNDNCISELVLCVKAK